MKQLQLIIPDLFPPQDIVTEVCAGLHLPALEKLLARGNASTSIAETLEDRLCAMFGVQSVAPVRAAADGLETGDGYWLCADPVNLQLQRAQMLLQPDVVPSQDDAISLCASLNEHFAGMGLHFSVRHPQRWYVRLEEDPQITSSPLRQVAWRDAKFHQPQGVDALRLQKIITEIQMLLYAHPANHAREVRGDLIISSLWLWGGGRAMPLQKAFDVLGGDSGLAGSFAQVAGVPQVESLQAMLDGQYGSGLWVCMAAGDALQRGDLYSWREAVQRIEQDFAKPLLKALRAGQLQQLTLQVLRDDGAQRFELVRSDAWKLWRSGRPLARYAV